MRVFLLSIFSVLFVSYATAQYTITDENGDLVNEGDVYCVYMDGSKSDYSAEFLLHSEISGKFVIDRVSTSQPDGSSSYFCAAGECNPPTNPTSDPLPLDGNNEAGIFLHYMPNNNNVDVTICYKIYKAEDPSVNLSFCVKYSTAPCSTGIEEVLSGEELSVYPNPASDKVTVKYTIAQNSQLRVYNIVGEKVLEYDLPEGSTSLDINVGSLPSGTYFYSLLSDTKAVETKRLVIRR